ncbi:hypothetical protein QYS49_24515 [Marivirga salinae]|uniref:Outer membrane protein beta-barrel domain-containing protein n=1 Tax=Marivirga salinarum TaxID=3059078 RepID=A0AA49GDZ5_9BACT|nr:hypothetical protein [Marivirga sp. BDSF4-3]WKK74811.2 hypothetical protein QYS49_24515 [Marivirga sp. BDSF4-3]
MKRFTFTLLLLITIITAQSELFAQSNVPDSKYKMLFKISSGYPGILYLDELTQPTRYEREAIVPLSAQIDYAFLPRISATFYFGYEYEKVSGTLTDFPGPTKSLVTGLGLEYHFIRNHDLRWIDPYGGITFYYYDTNYIPKGISPAFRIGANFFIYKNIGANINVGVGAALVEAGIIYGLDF